MKCTKCKKNAGKYLLCSSCELEATEYIYESPRYYEELQKQTTPNKP